MHIQTELLTCRPPSSISSQIVLSHGFKPQRTLTLLTWKVSYELCWENRQVKQTLVPSRDHLLNSPYHTTHSYTSCERRILPLTNVRDYRSKQQCDQIFWLTCSGFVGVWPYDPLHMYMWYVEIKWTEHETHQAARTCKRFVYSIVKITRLYDYQTWNSRNSRGAQRFVGFFLNYAFRMLIGWATNSDNTSSGHIENKHS